MTEEQRPYEELEKMAARTAEQLCGDPTAWVWVAVGKRRSADTANMAYGWYTHTEQEHDANLPAGHLPGNQARVRAVKRWVRETFPEARQRMLEYTSTLNARSTGVKEAQEWIDAEYHILDMPPHVPKLISPAPAGNPPARAATKQVKPARTQSTKQADNKVGDSAQRSTDQRAGQGGGDKHTAAPSGADETTLISTPVTAMAANASEATAVPFDWLWLKDIQQQLKWTDGTTTSFIKSLFKNINDTGDPNTVLPQLSREQLSKFTKVLNERAGNPQLL